MASGAAPHWLARSGNQCFAPASVAAAGLVATAIHNQAVLTHLDLALKTIASSEYLILENLS